MKRQWRIVFFGWATLFTSSFLIAQQPTPYRVYTTDNGLINNTVYHIMQDPKGYIWMATAGGLSRFDGRNFSNYTTEKGLPSNEVFKVYYGSNHIWALTFNGLAYYDEGSDKFVFYDESKKLLGWLDKSVGVAGVDTLRTIFCIDKDFSLCKITKDLQFIRVLKDTINIMINSSNNDLCFLTQNYLYSYKIKEGKIEKIRPHLKALAFGAHGVQSDFEIYDNTLIARNKNANTIVKWKFNTDSVNILYDTRNINNAFFSKTQIIRFNNQPHLWVSTTDGIHIFDWKTQKRVLPKIELENVVQDVFYDREGNYWVATKGEGIYHYTNLNIKTWGKKEGLSHPNIDNLCYAPDGSIISVSSNFNLYLINAQGKLETKIDLEANGGELKKIALLGDDLYLLQMGKLIFLKNFLSVCRENKLNTRLSDFNPVTYPYNHKLKVINTKSRQYQY